MMTAEEKIYELNILKASPGWAIMREQMEKEIFQAAMNMSKLVPDPVPDSYIRGCMFAAQKLIGLPEAMLLPLNNEVLMASAMKGHIPNA